MADLPAPVDRSDLIAMGTWVADCLDERDQLVFRTVVRGLVEEVERLRANGEVDRLRAALVIVHGYLVEDNPRVARLVAEDQLNWRPQSDHAEKTDR